MKYAFGVGAVLMAIIASILELSIIIENPWQILNPFVQLIVLLRFVTTPAVWILAPITFLFGILAATKH